MSIIGYARVSTTDQNLKLQLNALKLANCKKIFSEKVSGTQKKGQTKLAACLDYLREGDTLIVTRIDRLSRSLRDLENLVYELKKQGIYLKTTEQPIDTSNASGKAFLDMLGVFAEFETSLRKERQLEGIAKAKKTGKYKGRQPTAKAKSHQIINLIKEGFTRQSVADKLNIGIASVYRILKEYQENNQEIYLPGSRSKTKIAALEVYLMIENNSKYVRGKKKAREHIENDWKYNYNMEKLEIDGWDYVLRVPYKSMDELEETVLEIMLEAQTNADLKNCFIEISIKHKNSGQNWK